MHAFTTDASRALGGPAWIADRRLAAAERLADLTWPTSAEEVWRYSRIDAFDLDRYAPIPADELGDPGVEPGRGGGLLAAEAGERAGTEGVQLRGVRSLLEGDGTAASLSDKLAETPGGAEALASVSLDIDKLHVLRGGVETSVDDIARAVGAVSSLGGGQPLVVLDYVQKVAAPEGGADEERRMAVVAGALKDLALTAGVPVLAISASDAAGIADGTRLRTQNLRGASALAYEADCVLVLNEKFDVVARHHLVYGAANADRFHNFAVLTIEKNRGGMSGVDMEFRKRFEQARFERGGNMVEEQLVDSRLYVE